MRQRLAFPSPSSCWDDEGGLPAECRRLTLALALGLTACVPSPGSPTPAMPPSQSGNSSGEAPSAGSPQGTPPAPASSAVSATSTGDAPAPSAHAPSAQAPSPTEAPNPTEAPRGTLPSRPFAPPAFSPPFELTRADADGTWVAVGDAELSEPAARPPQLLFKSQVHPNPKNRFVSLDVVAIDLTRTSLHWVIGKKDHGASRLSPPQDPGLIPAAVQADVLAVFNGGFQARHGWWGMGSHGVAILEPKDHGCTLAIERDGAIRLGSWQHLGLDHRTLTAYRQTPPCLLEGGQVNEKLEKGQTRPWAGQNPDRKTRRRSCVGLNSEGTVLYFGIGTEAGPLDLARGMKAVGASVAAQLDINWAWTRFLLAGRREGQPRITSSLVEDPLVGKNEYFTRPSDRDFFYVLPK